MPSSRSVRLTAEALDDLRQITAYTFERWGEHQASRYLADLTRSINLLADFPDRGVPFHSRLDLLLIPARDYNIFYRIHPDEIEVVRIIHQRRNAAAQLQEP